MEASESNKLLGLILVELQQINEKQNFMLSKSINFREIKEKLQNNENIEEEELDKEFADAFLWDDLPSEE